MLPSGNYEGNLSNSGEEILIKDRSDSEILRFTYEDASPWPDGADGDGFSMASAAVNPGGDPGDYSYWTLSVEKDGNPFADNVKTPDVPVDPVPEGSLLVYPNPTTGNVTVHLFTDEVLEKMDIEIHSASGKLMKRLEIGNPGLIDLKSEGLPAGYYILGVKTEGYSIRKAIILTK